MPTQRGDCGPLDLLGSTIVVPAGGGDGYRRNRNRAAVDAADTVATEAEVVFETVHAVVINGCYVKRRKLICLVTLGTLVVAGGIVGIMLSITSPRANDSTPETASFVMPSTLEKFAETLPEFTQDILLKELPHGADRSNWFLDKCWSPKDDFSPHTAQGKAWKWLMADSGDSLESRSLIDTSNRFALATLYFSTNGPNWNNNTKWLSSEDVCDWWTSVIDESPLSYKTYLELCRGGMLSSQGVGMTQLILKENGLDGTLPPELGLMSALTTVRIDANSLDGDIPEFVWQNWQHLVTGSLSRNNFTGSVPSVFGLMTNLVSWKMESNQFTGNLPTEIGMLTDLWECSFFDNKLAGPIPTELGRATTLNTLSLANNLFTGPIPSELGKLHDLLELDLGHNHISGALPSELCFCHLLSAFHAENCRLTGSIPTEIGRWEKLKAAFLDGNDFTGSLPSELGKLTDLFCLDISNSRISGALPTQLGTLTKLTNLLISGTNISGSVPRTICNGFDERDALAGLVVDCNQVRCDCNCTCGSSR